MTTIEQTGAARLAGGVTLATAAPWIIGAVLLLVLPLIFADRSSITIMNQMAITVIFALAYNMLLGQGGMLSFGHAVYMGLGGFFCMHLINYVEDDLIPMTLPLLPLFGGLFGLGFAMIIGSFSTRKAGTVFAMISLGVGELIAACSIIVVAFFGGEEGISGDRSYAPFLGIEFLKQIEVYYLIAFWTLVSALLMYLFSRTPVGRMANAVRDNPERAEFLGYSARWVRYYSFCASGFFAGVAGALFAINYEILTEENLNLTTSGLILLMTFVIFGSFLFAMTTYGTAIVDYILHFASLSFEAYGPQSEADFAAALPEAARPLAADLMAGATNAWGSFDAFKSGLEGDAAALPENVLAAVYAAGEPGRQFGWQAGWTTFYWAWWIAFSPFVGLFLARISKGRSVREFIIGCVIAPALVCFAWMTILGGTAIDLELTGGADGAIIGASNTAKLFVTLGQMLSGGFLGAITVMCVVLILTFLVTSADSGILVMNTIMSGGEQQTGIKHRIVWGVILTLVIGTLLIAGKTNGGADPMEALKSAMIIGALPFTMVMGLMCIALAKALYRDGLREKAETAPAE